MSKPQAGRRPAIRGSLLAALLALGVNIAIDFVKVAERGAGAGYPGPVNTVIFAVMPFVWIGLFGAIGTAWFLLRAGGRPLAVPTAAAAVLLANCVLFPIYTGGFAWREPELAGNGLIAVLAAFAIGTALEREPRAAMLLMPVVVWGVLASIGLIAVMTGCTF